MIFALHVFWKETRGHVRLNNIYTYLYIRKETMMSRRLDMKLRKYFGTAEKSRFEKLKAHFSTPKKTRLEKLTERIRNI